ncbi:MAG TPA: sulfite oxidase [Lichenihabitans sp.]|jgi:DMSO/TMAO reductase YedYZ molybdopterin-dependent catalytic subunit|nr:sulfite oxidase [Lichenihabitans sp.]
MGYLQRRDVLLGSGAAAGLMLLDRYGFALAAQAGDKLVPWSDQPSPVPPPAQAVIRNLTPWEDLDTWITPNDKFFSIGHYEWPALDPAKWRLDVLGQVGTPLSLKLDDLKTRPRQEVTFTLECSGSNGLPFFTSGIGNAQWAGVSLADILKTAQIKSDALDVVFFGADQGQEVLRGGTPGELKFTGHFARSMSVADAMNPANILCYEMNGEALPAAHGAPVRLIAPGWFGIANVKWLRRIEVRDKRFMGRFMGRDYVTVREEQRDGEMIVEETSVGRGLLKSAPGRVTRNADRYRISGMAWGPAPIAAVEVKVDDGPWMNALLAEADHSPFAWRFWNLDWPATPGDHSITSRAIDTTGNTQPTMDDPIIANKKTYWESNGQITRHVRIG